jgi:hypothetical protein
MSSNLNLTTVLQNQDNKEATINTNTGNIDAAITETTDISVTSGNATVTSTQQRTAQRLNITGATTAGRTVTLAATKKLLYITSDSANTQSISLVRGSTTYTLAAGAAAMVYVDGTTNGLFAAGLGTTNVAVASALNDLRLTRLRLTANQSIPNNAWTAITWPATADQDDVTAFSSGAATRLTVPTGYTRVRFTLNIGWENVSTGSRYVQVAKNGATEIYALDIRGAVNEAGATVTTVWLPVVATDYFEFRVIQNSGVARNLVGGAAGTFGATQVCAEWWTPGLPLNTQTGNYTAVLTDAFKAVEMNVGSANNFTIPLNATVAFPIGTVLVCTQIGAGQTTIVATGGVTIRNPAATLNIGHQYGTVSLRKRGTDEWVISGDLA